MSGGIERQIFEDAGRPDEHEIPNDRLDEAVSDAIHNIDRGPPERIPPPQRSTPQPGQPADGDDDRSHSGLLRALMDERFKRQSAEERSARYEQAQRDADMRNQKPAISERLFSDPDGTLSELRKEWTAPLEQRIQQMQLNQDFALAQVRHGDTFAQAWSAWYEQVKEGRDATTYFTIMNSASPAETMVQWYRRMVRDQEVGDDLDAYKQKVIDDYFANGGGGGPRIMSEPPGRPREPNGQFTARPQAPRYPTNISRMGAPSREDDELAGNDGSDAAIFAAATRKPQRRR